MKIYPLLFLSFISVFAFAQSDSASKAQLLLLKQQYEDAQRQLKQKQSELKRVELQLNLARKENTTSETERKVDPTAIVSFVERTQHNKEYLRNPNKASDKGLDINSELVVRLNKDEIRKDIALGKANQTDLKNLFAYLQALERYKDQMPAALEKVSNSYLVYTQNPTPANTLLYAQAIKARSALFLDMVQVAQSIPQFREVYNSEYERAIADENVRLTVQMKHQIALTAIAAVEPIFNRQIDSLLTKDGVRVALAAWITKRGEANSSTIHIDGFDDYAPGTYYAYDRFQLALTEEQQAELKRLDESFKGMQPEEVFKKVGEQVKSQIQTELDNQVQTLDSLWELTKDSFIQTYKQNLDSLPIKYPKLVYDIHRLDSVMNLLQVTINRIVNQVNSPSVANVNLASVSKLQGEIVGLTQDLSQVTQALKEDVNDPRLRSDLKGIIQSGVEQVKSKATQFASNSNPVFTIIQQLFPDNDLVLIKKQALELTDKVKQHTVTDLPEEGVIDLLYTGKRKFGDRLTVRLYYFGNDSAFGAKGKIRKQATFTLMNALPSVNMTVQYQFAKPFGLKGDTARFGGNWKSGPGYSTLFKFGSRNAIYKEFVDVGLGVNIAAFDFNRDDIPEFAVAGVVSIFRDYIQGGIGYNVNAKSAYGFFGVRLPLPYAPISIPASKTNFNETINP